MALADVMEGWKGEGQIGDNCPKVVMAIPCAVTGKGYFFILGDGLAQTRSEIVKYEPAVDSYRRILHLDSLTFLGAKICIIVVPSLEIYCGPSLEDTTLILCRKVRLQSISNMHVSVF